MATRDRLHILVPSAASSEAFSPSVLGRGGASPPSPADRGAHGRRLKDDLDALGAAARARRAQTDVRVAGAVEGVYIQFESVPGFDLELTALEPRQGKVHPELRSVTERLVAVCSLPLIRTCPAPRADLLPVQRWWQPDRSILDSNGSAVCPTGAVYRGVYQPVYRAVGAKLSAR